MYTFEGFVSDTIGRVKTDANEKYIYVHDILAIELIIQRLTR